MYHPTTRLLTILELLQSRGSITGPELAGRLEVEVRSVRRYITMLRDMGIPIDAERGRDGAYMLRPGYRLPPLMFNEDEMLAIILGLMTARKLSIAASMGVESASAKIERVLPAELRQRVWALQSTLTLNMQVDIGDNAPSGGIIAALSLAAHQQQSIFIRYRVPQGAESSRVIDPYGLVYHVGLWYTVGHCHLRHDLRVFRLDRILSIVPQDETFIRPENFDPLQYVMESIATMPGGALTEVLLRTTLDDARMRVPPDMATLEIVENGVLMRCWTGNLAWLARYLVGMGCAFVVIAPDELRDELRNLAVRIHQMAEETG
ncbi:MAG: YafY family transcriptional regulator [Chitinophagaceae bacterium]|nr:YafY family transcriptional regulator [Anaerolineae bacterium]